MCRAEKAQAGRSKRTGITADAVLKELANLTFANAGDYFEWRPDGVTLIDKENLTREQLAAVAEVSQTITKEGGTIRLKLHDKGGAIRDAMRHLGLLVHKHEHSGQIDMVETDAAKLRSRIASTAARVGAGQVDSESEPG